tara:strand:+ start:2353 stop:3510 length:1158 start_codon:yes stop_codon:yes gene_type:complete
MILKYITLGIVLFYVFFIIYFKLRYPFWSKQPIFYYHDIKNLIYPKGIIELSLPNISNKLSKTINYKNVTDITPDEKETLIKHLTEHYMPESYEKYTPTNNDVMDHLLCRKMPSNISLYYDGLYGLLIGSMTSAYKQFHTKHNTLNVGYVDNLCVNKKHRGKNIAGQIIYNHYVRERYQEKTAVYMFKHEGISRPFVPLTIYDTYFYKLDLFEPIVVTQTYLTSILIGKTTTHLLYDLQRQLTKSIHTNDRPFTCVIMDDFEHLTYLIEKKHIYVYALIEEKEPVAFYFFKNIYTTYDGDKSIECFACIKYKTSLENDKFLLGFYLAIDYLKTIDKYKILLLENISDTHHLIKQIKHRPFHRSKYYYYMYNYAMRPVSAKNIVII